MTEAEKDQSIIRVISVYTNGRRNQDGSRVVEGVKILTSDGASEIFVEPEYDQEGRFIGEKRRPLVDTLARIFYQIKAAH